MNATDAKVLAQRASGELIRSNQEADKLPPLPAELRELLSEHCTHYANRRVGLIWVMQQLQAYYGGWLPNRAIYEAAEIVGIAPPDAEGVATFFNWFFREPVGRKIIVVCDSISCYLGGYDRNREHLENKLGIRMGETTPDGEYTLLPIVCLGNCDKAPTMMVGEDLHDNVTPELLEKIFQNYGTMAGATT
ncbi:MAG: NADH-quinone oxidoreductase subunit NuoE [Candidatus Sumerlaeaceae bacterium]